MFVNSVSNSDFAFCSIVDKVPFSRLLFSYGSLAIYYKSSQEHLEEDRINDYLFHCQNLHKTPSESFFKHTIFGLRAAYKVMGMEVKRIALPQIKRRP
jgi:hypothetical protein